MIPMNVRESLPVRMCVHVSVRVATAEGPNNSQRSQRDDFRNLPCMIPRGRTQYVSVDTAFKELDNGTRDRAGP